MTHDVEFELRVRDSQKYKSKISKQYSKHQTYFKYLLIIYPNIQAKLVYMLSLGIFAYIIPIYM